ncbi:MAG: hypothetical protein KDC26_01540 [Armatimonadetes bacterium]|nr:hypothetical protein [Armatimonadota bacterium]
MIATLIAASSILGQEKSAKDFYPLIPNSTWVYEESQKGKKDKSTLEMTVNEAVKFRDHDVIPVANKMGRQVTNIYYQVTDSEVFVLGYDLEQMLDKPIPILKLQGKEANWNYRGSTQLMGYPASLSMQCTSKLLGKRKVLGEECEILEVKYKAVIDEDSGGLKIESEQTALYAAGIGLYEMKEIGNFGKQRTERSLKLISYEKGN